MYSVINFPSKKAFRDAVKTGQKCTVFQPNDMFNTPIPANGRVCVEGPHYPRPHSWYATVELRDGYAVSVK